MQHTDAEFKELAIEHNNLFAAFKQRGQEIKDLEDLVLGLQKILANVEKALKGE
jgi:hypothetical protein